MPSNVKYILGVEFSAARLDVCQRRLRRSGASRSLIKHFQVGSVTIGGGELFLIAGPCVIESEEHALKMAEAISAIARQKNLPYIFKASYDKANRTSIRSFRGPGLEEGLRILRKVREHDEGACAYRRARSRRRSARC